MVVLLHAVSGRREDVHQGDLVICRNLFLCHGKDQGCLWTYTRGNLIVCHDLLLCQGKGVGVGALSRCTRESGEQGITDTRAKGLEHRCMLSAPAGKPTGERPGSLG